MSLGFFKENQKGVGLIETIVALTLAVVVVTSLVSLTVFSLRSSQKSQDLMRGTKMASEQLEMLRAFRDSESWSAASTGFWAKVYACTSASPCRISNSGTSYNISTGITTTQPTEPNAYNVYFFVTDTNGNTLSSTPLPLLRVSAVVKWANNGAAYSYTDLSNWRNN